MYYCYKYFQKILPQILWLKIITIRIIPRLTQEPNEFRKSILQIRTIRRKQN